ncbi:MAG: hypothetical protein COA36_00240 [Desulfotalea sp.]|nr:MAG: hypothetical protein COA36_00240 [Desulfotalea sp.]
MNYLLLVPVVLSFYLLGAHFLREGQAIIGFCVVALPFILLIRKRWVVRLVQFFLLAGAVEWVMTLLLLRAIRIDYGLPWLRLVIIIGAVACICGGSALVFLHPSLKDKYGFGKVINE